MERAVFRNPIALSLLGLGLIVLLMQSVSIVPETKQAIISNYGNAAACRERLHPKASALATASPALPSAFRLLSRST